MEATSNKDGESAGLLLGKVALARGLITPEQLREALAEQARDVASGRASPRKLGNILLSKGLITDRQLEVLLEEQKSKRKPAPSPPTPAAPKIPPFGKYRIVREVGRGAMGIVYEAVDSELNRKVALKTLLSGPDADPQETALEEERFLKEARLSASVAKHPHIVSIYETGTIKGRRYIAMEYVEGRQMSEWRKSGHVSLRQQVRLLRDVALAIHHAHKEGLVHRDLKPANVLVDDKNAPHITDFGLAKSMARDAGLTIVASGQIAGTPLYMSPEQARGLKDVDRRTDIYPLGVMLYEALTGKTPFRGESRQEILMKLLADPVPSPSSVPRTVGHHPPDPVLERICLKALEKDPQNRYPTAQAFADEISGWLEGKEVAASPPRPDRTRLYVAAGIAGAVALVFLVFLLTRSSRSPQTALLREAAGRMKADEYPKAWELYLQVLREDPSNREAVRGLKAAEDIYFGLLDKWAAQLADEGQFDDADAVYDAVLKAEPNYPRAAAGRAMVRKKRLDARAAEAERFLEAGDVVNASMVIGEIMAEDPSHPKALALRERLSRKGPARTPAPPGPGKAPPPLKKEEPPKPPPVPPPRPPATPPRDPAAQEIVLGPAVRSSGIELRAPPDSVHQATTHGGKPCFMLRGPSPTAESRRLYFDVDDSWTEGLGAVEVEVEYFDAAGAYWELEYDSADFGAPFNGICKRGGTSHLTMTNAWKREILRLEDPNFRNRQDRLSDFRINTGQGTTYLHRVAVRRIPGTRPARPPAPPPGPQVGQKDAEGWTCLFNGRDLTGWRKVGDRVRAEEGILLMEGAGEIQQQIPPADFEVRGSLRLDGGNPPYGNVGAVAVRRAGSRRDTENRFMFHMDGDIHIGEGASLGKSGPGKVLLGKWHAFLLRARGRDISLEIDGKPAVKGRLSRLEPGHLALYGADTGSAIAFKDLWLREIR